MYYFHYTVSEFLLFVRIIANPSHPYGMARTDVPVDVAKRPYDLLLGATKSDEISTRKTYRAPSPVRDYRNPSTLPFRDFSQT